MKTETTHTPGPWTQGTGWIKAANGRKVCAGFPYRPDGESEANMALVAAAPELLAICVSIAGELQAWRSTDDPRPATWTVSRLTRLHAAIAKAGGGR